MAWQRNITVHSCGGSRGIDRVPFLASAAAEEPRKRKATHGVGAGQCLVVSLRTPSRASLTPTRAPPTCRSEARPRRERRRPVGARLAREGSASVSNENPCQLTPNPRPCSPTRLVTGALHRVKRETGESCALLKAMSVRCCPRNGKRAKRQIHCACSSAWEGDAYRSRRQPAPS
ncbi:hypothetical protein PS903_02912 [Pseudomonas fluorescens]|nr:hypothetical protein PS903_02912 [Pseudomonas fluorescens]